MISHAAFPKTLLYCFIGPLRKVRSFFLKELNLIRIFIFLGTCMSSDLVWELTDFANYLMVLPNVIGLFGCTALVVALSKEEAANAIINQAMKLHK